MGQLPLIPNYPRANPDQQEFLPTEAADRLSPDVRTSRRRIRDTGRAKAADRSSQADVSKKAADGFDALDVRNSQTGLSISESD